MNVNSKYRTICFAVFAFPYSNYRYIHVTERMNDRSFVDAFTAFTKHIGGVYPILSINNMKIAVRHKFFRNQQFKLTTLFQQLEEHYNIEIRPCTPFRPNQKGTVDNAVKTLKTHLFAYQSEFVSLKELQSKVHATFQQLNQQKHHEKTTLS